MALHTPALGPKASSICGLPALALLPPPAFRPLPPSDGAVRCCRIPPPYAACRPAAAAAPPARLSCSVGAGRCAGAWWPVESMPATEAAYGTPVRKSLASSRCPLIPVVSSAPKLASSVSAIFFLSCSPIASAAPRSMCATPRARE
eukprot:4155735-Prymnesium_polylepis.1